MKHARFHGFRSVRLSAACAPPVATSRRPVGAKNSEPGKKCRLQIDHVIPISQGGTDEEHNLRAVCHGYNKDKANLKVPTSRDAISAMALIRRQPRDVQLEVYEFLAKKFGAKPGGK
ncbi:MAG: HNH endonuclease [Phycisphaerae bacterium]|nr:HNH endonuclease [Phycisphaerae bacterium]